MGRFGRVAKLRLNSLSVSAQCYSRSRTASEVSRSQTEGLDGAQRSVDTSRIVSEFASPVRRCPSSMSGEGEGERKQERAEGEGSEVVVMEGALGPPSDVPTISSLNINKSSRVHIGPKFVNVTQNVNNTEVVKGRILGLDLVSAKRARSLRCSVAVFVCWAFIVASGLAFYLFYVALPKQRTRLDIGLEEPWYLRREDWQAMSPYTIEWLQLPVKYVIVGHSATKYCEGRYSCMELVMAIQQSHLRRGFDDIGPNFLVGGGGIVFEGRGANVIGAMVYGWNSRSITVMFLGNYSKVRADSAQLEHVMALLDALVAARALQSDYALYGHCQIATQIISPGPNIMERLANFSHWDPVNANKCLPG